MTNKRKITANSRLFKADLANSHQWVEAARRVAEAHSAVSHTVEILDPADQRIRGDFEVHNKDGSMYTIEVKSGVKAAETGNAFFETLTNVKTGSLGWYAYPSTYHRLVDYDETTKGKRYGRYWVYDINAIKAIEAELPLREVEVKRGTGLSRGLIVSLDCLKSKGLVKEVIYDRWS